MKPSEAIGDDSLLHFPKSVLADNGTPLGFLQVLYRWGDWCLAVIRRTSQQGPGTKSPGIGRVAGGTRRSVKRLVNRFAWVGWRAGNANYRLVR